MEEEEEKKQEEEDERRRTTTTTTTTIITTTTQTLTKPTRTLREIEGQTELSKKQWKRQRTWKKGFESRYETNNFTRNNRM